MDWLFRTPQNNESVVLFWCRYNFAFEGDNLVLGLERVKLVFSSYPASIYSGDDFYVTSNNIVITQSTITPINPYIYQDVIDVKQYIPDFFRIMISNYIAKSGVFHS